MNLSLKSATLGLTAAAAAAFAVALPAAPASASCTTVIIGDQKTCFESIPCELRDAVTRQLPPKVQATLDNKFLQYECVA